MKERFLWMLAAIFTICGTMTTLTSCSDDDDNAANNPLAGQLEGL